MTYLLLLCILIFPASAAAQDAIGVKYVIDGDTVVLENNRHVRYIGIDAPEIFYKNNMAQPFGYAARDYNQKLVKDQKVYLSYGRQKLDAYGRSLAYVYDMDKRFINRLMLLKGYAYCLYLPPNIRYHVLLLKAQQTAMNERIGIWAHAVADEKTFIGNMQTKRFHLPTCPFGKRTAKRNRIEFKSHWDAFWEGYAPCKRCLSLEQLTRMPAVP